MITGHDRWLRAFLHPLARVIITALKGLCLDGLLPRGGSLMSLPPIDLGVFHENGYVRKQCRVTSLWFWTSDFERDTCGDTSEDEYTFIGAPLIGGFDQAAEALKDAMREGVSRLLRGVQSTPVLTPTRCWLGGVMTST